MEVKVCGYYPANAPERIKEILSEHHVVHIPDPDDLYQIRDAECILLRQGAVPKEIIEQNPNLKAVIRWGAGYDTVDIKAAGERGVIVANLPGANAYAVSELAVAFMIMVSRRIVGFYRNCQKGYWESNAFGDQSLSLNNKVVGILGGGNIGRQVAAKVRAFGAKVCSYDVYRLAPAVEEEYGMRFLPLEEVISKADILSLHLPLLESTHHIIGNEELAKMKVGAVIINTARGGLVDDEALLEALNSGRIAGAGLDCLEDEASLVTRELLQRPNVIITPHIGGATSDLADVMIPMVVGMIRSLSENGAMEHTVNSEYLVHQGKGELNIGA